MRLVLTRQQMYVLGHRPIVGVAAAIANAIYHATGKRVRELPLSKTKLAG